MKYGVTMFPTDYSIRPDDVARAAEQRGFESIFFPEHTHIPTSRKTPFPGGGELPKEYSHTHDPFVALTMAAAATKKLRIGTGICLVIEHDPIVLAKQVASLDMLSGGRFIFGIGAGWNVEEMGNHGTAFKSRWKLLRERVEAMQACWTKDEAAYHGEMVKFDPIWSYPKPATKPHPPVLLGGHGPKAMKRVVRYCDGWIPIGFAVPELPKQIAELRQMAADAGRDPKTISISLFGAPGDKDAIAKLGESGVERVIFWLPPDSSDKVLPVLDRHAKLIGA